MDTQVSCPQCGKEVKNLKLHTQMAHKVDAPTLTSVGDGAPSLDGERYDNPVPQDPSESKTNEMLGQLIGMVKGLNERMNTMEIKTGVVRDNTFKRGATQQDIANVQRVNVDERASAIVDEILGEDFGIEVEPRGDQPGFLFTLLVPRRLSDVPESTRPVIDPETKKYKIDPTINKVVEETYWPGDRRSRAIAGHQSYEAVREHCERVRAYVVTYFQKNNRPIPEFKLRSNA